MRNYEVIKRNNRLGVVLNKEGNYIYIAFRGMNSSSYGQNDYTTNDLFVKNFNTSEYGLRRIKDTEVYAVVSNEDSIANAIEYIKNTTKRGALASNDVVSKRLADKYFTDKKIGAFAKIFESVNEVVSDYSQVVDFLKLFVKNVEIMKNDLNVAINSKDYKSAEAKLNNLASVMEIVSKDSAFTSLKDIVNFTKTNEEKFDAQAFIKDLA